MKSHNRQTITIQCVIKWIEMNLDEDLSTEIVAHRAGYSKWHLQRIFKSETGHSMGSYIKRRKLTEIARALETNNCKILDLAFKYNFNSQQSLTRCFTKYFGIPPSKCRYHHESIKWRYCESLLHITS